MTCFPGNLTQQDIIQAIKHTSPRPYHTALLDALNRAIPGCTFRFVLTKAGWHRAGGVLAADGKRLSEELETWVNAELEKCDDDFGEFLERYAAAGLLATRHIGRSHYFVAAYGPAPEDFLQLEIEELQEVMDRRLIDPEQPPCDRTELVEPTGKHKLDAHPVGGPCYRFARMSDIRQVQTQQNALAGGMSALARFTSDWSHSRAMDRGHFSEHWLIAGLESFQPDSAMPFRIAPMSVHARALKPFHWDETKTGVEMGNQIRDFDRAAGYPGAWYFHFVAGKFVPESLVSALKRDLDEGYRYLADKDMALLEKVIASPYPPGFTF